MNRNDPEYWEDRYRKLKEYYEETGNSNVPQKFVTRDGFSLGTWVASQRIRKKDGRLEKDKIERLEKLGFCWDIFKAKWEEGLEHLKAFVKEYGHARVPKGYESPDGYQLGAWVKRQRARAKNPNDKRAMTPEEREELNRLGMEWTVDIRKRK